MLKLLKLLQPYTLHFVLKKTFQKYIIVFVFFYKSGIQGLYLRNTIKKAKKQKMFL